MRRASLLALTFLITVSAHAAIDDTMRRGFNVSEGGKLTVNVDVGNVTIVTGGTGVAVEVVRTARTSDAGRAAEVFREHAVQFAQNGNDVTVTTDWDHDDRDWFNFGGSPLRNVKFNIRVPARYSVDVRTSGGNINVSRINGATELRTSGGNVTIEGASGDVLVRTSGGNIRIGDVNGIVDARTSGGNVMLARVGGTVTARTSGGNIKIEGSGGAIDASTSGGSIEAAFATQPRGDSRLSTSGGNVRVALAPNIGAQIDAKSNGGGVRSDVPVTVIGTQKREQLQGTIGGGGPKLTLRTSGGGIAIRPLG
ncbi:MAG TPA: DUF4097 family beta strand repeat-containing protein [Thermoanaerobaculia bacterium]